MGVAAVRDRPLTRTAASIEPSAQSVHQDSPSPRDALLGAGDCLPAKSEDLGPSVPLDDVVALDQLVTTLDSVDVSPGEKSPSIAPGSCRDDDGAPNCAESLRCASARLVRVSGSMSGEWCLCHWTCRGRSSQSSLPREESNTTRRYPSPPSPWTERQFFAVDSPSSCSDLVIPSATT